MGDRCVSESEKNSQFLQLKKQSQSAEPKVGRSAEKVEAEELGQMARVPRGRLPGNWHGQGTLQAE